MPQQPINSRRRVACLLLTLVVTAGIPASNTSVDAGEYLNGIKWKEPAVVTPGKTDAAPPSDAVVLFDGTSLKDWKNGSDGVRRVAYSEGKIVQGEFGDCQLHIEWTLRYRSKASRVVATVASS